MLRKDKNSSAGAPSLLTPAQQAEAERNRILSTLESTGGKRPASPAAAAARGAGSRWTWGLAVLLLVVLAGGAGLWYGQQGASAPPVVIQAVAEPVAEPLASPPAPSAPATATIEDDKGTHDQSLSDMLAAEPATAAATVPAAATDGASGDVLSQALEAPSGSALAAAALPVAAKAAPAKPKPPVKRASAPAPKPKAVPKPAAPPDGDVLLLSALIAHANAAETAGQKNARASLDQELAWCKKQTKISMAACRQRACDGRATAAACKVKR